jgi:hypothetical protein
MSSSLTPCSRDYDVASRRYFIDIAAAVPADLIARAYSSVRGMWDLPFRAEGPPVDGWFPLLYRARAKALMHLEWIQPALVLVALAGLAIVDVRWGASATLILLYVGGYPALQSNVRHYFHLEFITWWALGWTVSAVIALAIAARRSGVAAAFRHFVPQPRAALLRASAFACAVVLVLAGVLGLSRWYQQRELARMFDQYVAAPKAPIAAGDAVPSGSLMELDVDAPACDGRAVRLIYDTTKPGADFSSTIPLPASAAGAPTKIFFPVYQSFSGVKAGGCLRSMSRVADVRPFPLLMTAVLAPGWQSRPLYQRIK